MKIKEKPEEFIVDEVFKINTKEEGDYACILLKKTNWTTQRAILAIAKALRITKRRIGFAGTKDKFAVTSQLISIFKIKKEDVEGLNIKDIELEFLGYSDERVTLGDLEKNKFKIKMVLSKKEKEILEKQVLLIRKTGFINYFGTQRFSSGSSAKIGKAIIKGDFENAAKAMLSMHSKNTKEFDDFVLANWKDWKQILKKCPRYLGFESAVLNYLVNNPTDYAGALRKIPKPTRRIFVRAFQSLIWNRSVSKLVSGKSIILPGHKIILPTENFKLPTSLEIPGKDSSYSGDFGKILLSELKREGVVPNEFRVKAMPELEDFGTIRNTIIKPKKLKFEGDWISFELEKGVYATVLLSHLTLSSHKV